MPKLKRKKSRARSSRRSKKPRKAAQEGSKKLEVAIIAAVLLVGALALYFMFQVNAGRAFYQAPQQITVVQKELQFCCCKTQNDRMFEVFGQVLEDADPFTKEMACRETCEGPDHSTPTSPSKLYNVGKCGAMMKVA